MVGGSMQRGWEVLVLVAVAAFGAVATAQKSSQQQKPLTVRERDPLTGPEFDSKPQAAPKEFGAMMRQNNGVLQVEAITEGGGGDATATPAAARGVVTFRGSLGRFLAAPEKEDWDG